MPRVGNYQNCKIYKIISYSRPELVYFGHTCQELSQRMAKHRHISNTSTSKQIIDIGDANILLVVNFPCLDRNEAQAKEAEFILNNICVNRNIPNRTTAQYQIDNAEHIKEVKKQYRIDNDDHIREVRGQYKIDNNEQIKLNDKIYRDAHKDDAKIYYELNKYELLEKQYKYHNMNKDKINTLRHKKHNCECGGKYIHIHHNRHLATQKHLNFILQNAQTIE